MLIISAIDRVAARRLSWFLKTLLGVEVIIGPAVLSYVTVIGDGKVLIYLYKTKLNKLNQTPSIVLARRDPRHADKRALHRY